MSKSQYGQPRTGSRGHSAPRIWRRLFRTCRCGCASLVVLATLGLADSTNADSSDRWRPNSNVGLQEGVTLRIHWFESSRALREAAKRDGREIRQMGLHGFSVLKRNTETGGYVCDVYVMKMTGEQVDGDRTRTFGHEVLHCFGLEHE